nr:hypothetical protein [Clostridia bacterium]
MKKLISLLLALAMTLGCAAFAEGVDYTGVWVLSSLETPEMTMDMTLLNNLGMDMSMTLNADGTMFTTTLGETENGTWTVTENGIAITDDEETIRIAYANDALRIETDGAAMVLTREGAAPAVAEAASPEGVDLTGPWVLMAVEMFGVQIDPVTLGLTADMELYEDGTCLLTMMDESQEGTWAVTETGITTTDAEGVVDAYTLVDGRLVAEQDGMKLIFVAYVPLGGLTAADFNGNWSFSYLEVYDYSAMTQAFYDSEELGLTIALSLADGKGRMEMASEEGTEIYQGECVVEDLEDGSSVMYFMMLDENGAQDGTGLMLTMYPGGELTWYEYYSETDVEYYYNFELTAE